MTSTVRSPIAAAFALVISAAVPLTAHAQDTPAPVIHDTETLPGSTVSPYDQAIATFQKPASGSSSHYVIRSSDGQVTQMVPTKDVAWHAGNWTMNEHSIGIEHEGIATQGGTWYTEQMYRASADLVRYLAAKYHIPLDRRRILATRTSRGNARATSRPRTGIRVPTGTGRTTGTCRARR